MTNEITEVTRRSIIDYLTVSGVNWAGRLDEDDFLARLYDLTALRSTDYRISNAGGDIRQHRINFSDWEDDWVFYDDRFNLFRGSDESFLRFLCETLHPVVRPDSEIAREMATFYNRELAADGWQIVEGKQMSGRPIFVAQKVGSRSVIYDEPTGWQKVDRQIQEVRSRLDSADSEEECQAIGLICREILISLGAAVFDPTIHESPDGVTPSETDAGRMIEAIFATELRGGANEEARRHAKAALQLALALQHKRTADYVTAALCAEATVSVVNLIAVISGQRRRIG